MNVNKDLARKLAKKIISSVPKDKESLGAVSDFLGLLALLYRKEPRFRDFVLSPFVPNQGKKAFIKSLIQKGQIPKEIEFFVDELIDLNLLRIVAEIKRLFDYEAEKILSVYKGKLIFAKEPTKELIDEVIKRVEKVLNRKIEADVAVDDTLIGGFELRLSGLVLDTSVRTVLQNLSNKVKSL
ncbi:ATP synthase F1 subunit delta [Hydrogenobaculum acidophilum]